MLFDTSVFSIFTIANLTSSIINGQPVGSFVEICLSGDRGGCTSDEDAPAILVAIDSPEDFEKVASSDMLVAAVAEAVTEPVPDPASWAMVIAGFGLTGAAMRRRRTLAVT